MKIIPLLLFLLFAMVLENCKTNAKIEDLSIIPKFTEKDKKFENAYQILDGKWKGQFKIYQDHNRVPKEQIDLKNISLQNLKKGSIRLSNTIMVEQTYQSETPYFQRVIIKDYYPDTGKEVIAKGVNKVEDGKLICVVIKPDDTVIHDGFLENEQTIIWQRREENPQKVEYFREVVDEQFYEIIGWGYYEGDDLSRSPAYWFHGKYQRVIDE